MSRSLLASFFHGLGKRLDESGLLWLSIFLVIFIPLYPKLPLFDAIPGYLVKVRLEDILVLVAGCWWLSEVFRRKIVWWNSVVLMMSLYAVVGFISILSGVFLLQTIPLEPLHVGKSLLHYFRYLEYFSLFVFLFSKIKSLEQVKAVLGLLSIAVMVIVIYAVGQLNWEWPVYSTMNREYSKGAALTLGEDARVQSTFAGHYDLSAFLVLLLPFLIMAALTHPRWWTKIWFAGVALLGGWLLVETGSKFSLVAGVIGITLTWFFYLRRYPRIWKVSVSVGGISAIVGLGLLLFVWLNPQNPQIVASLQKVRQSTLVSQVDLVARSIDKVSLLLADRQLATLSSEPEPESAPLETAIQTETDQPQWSENTLKYGLSMGIRLDTLWPQALRGLARSLLWGSGYGTLNKTGNTMFVEADSTDNNLLRTAGETGLLGFLSFYLIIWFAFKTVWKTDGQSEWITDTIRIGFLGATIGIILNGLMIDVFVASKVAFTFWALAGLSYKAMQVSRPEQFNLLEKARWKWAQHALTAHWPFWVSLIVMISVLQRYPLVQTGQIANLAVDPTATEALSTVRCWMTERTWNLCQPGKDLASSTSYLYGGLLLTSYQISHMVGTFYYVNLGLACISLVAGYKAVRTFLKRGDLVFGHSFILICVLFLSRVVFIPIDENVGMALSALLAMAGCRWWLTRQKVWVFVSLVVGVAVLSVLPAISFNWWWVVFSPVWSLGLIVGGDWLLRNLTTSVPMQRSLVPMIVLLAAGVLFTQPVFQNNIRELLTESRAESQNWNVQSVRVLNDFFASDAAAVPVTNDQTPVIVMALPPDFVELYRTHPYAAYSLSDFDSLQNRIEGTNSPTFLTNIALTTSAQEAQFRQVRERYDLDLLTEGCAENCNLYKINAQPSLYSEKILENQNQYSFLIFNQSFVTDDPTSLKLLQNQLLRLRQIDQGPDFVIAIGDRVTQLKVDGVPVYFVGNSSSPEVMDEFLSLRTPHDLFLFLNSSQDGSIASSQHLKHLNALLDVELDPTLKNIFVISDRLQLAADERLADLLPYTERTRPISNDNQFHEQLEKYINQTPATAIYYLSGDFGLIPNAFPAVLYQEAADAKRISLASSVRWRPNDVIIRIDVGETGQAYVKAIRLNDLQPFPIQEYGSSYWLNTLQPKK